MERKLTRLLVLLAVLAPALAAGLGVMQGGPKLFSSSSSSGGGSSGGGLAYDQDGQDAAYDSLYTTALAAQTATSTIYVATTGNDTTCTGAVGSKCATIGKGISLLSAGSHLIIGDGTYSGASNWISTKQRTIPSGTDATHMTVIRAENPFAVRIVISSNPSAYEDGPVQIASAVSNLWVDGIVAEDTHTAPASDDNTGNTIDFGSCTGCRGTRLIVKKKSVDQYGGAFGLSCTGLVLEDTAAIGSGRYMYQGGTGGGSSSCQNVVIRRAICSMQFGQALEPSACFSMYGSNTGTYALIKDHLFANAYSIDSPHLPQPAGQNAEDRKWGDTYHPKSVRNIEHVGSGTVNTGSEYGAFRTDNYGGGSDVLATFDDIFVAQNTNGNSSDAVSKASNGLLTISHYSICNGGSVPASGSTNTNGLTSGVTYPVVRSGSNGAEQLYAVGVFLSTWGATNYKTPQTSMKLWPYPYERDIATVFGETITKSSNDVPTGVTTSTNPFTGTANDGNTKTVTRRIWEACGGTMPSLASGAGVYP